MTKQNIRIILIHGALTEDNLFGGENFWHTLYIHKAITTPLASQRGMYTVRSLFCYKIHQNTQNCFSRQAEQTQRNVIYNVETQVSSLLLASFLLGRRLLYQWLLTAG